jgi:hypothetical protein
MKGISKTIVLGLVAALGIAGAARAEENDSGGLQISGGIDFTCSYYFRGLLQEKDGFIAQPYATLSATIVDRDGFSITPYVGIWNSFHSRKTGTTGTNDSWYEADWIAGAEIGLGDFTLDLVFIAYTYPNGAADTILEIGAILSYDDSALAERLGLPFALNPYIGIYKEISDQNPGGTEDAYMEIGLGPSFEFNAGRTTVTVEVPMALGISLDDYYFDSDGDERTLGFGSIGVVASIPLRVPSKYGEWSLSAGLTYLRACAHSARSLNDGHQDAWIGTVGLSFAN